MYERGPIAAELEELRAASVTKEREIDRLTRENVRLMEDLRRAGGRVAGAGRGISANQAAEPPLDRASINQTLVNSLWARARMSNNNNQQP